MAKADDGKDNPHLRCPVKPRAHATKTLTPRSLSGDRIPGAAVTWARGITPGATTCGPGLPVKVAFNHARIPPMTVPGVAVEARNHPAMSPRSLPRGSRSLCLESTPSARTPPPIFAQDSTPGQSISGNGPEAIMTRRPAGKEAIPDNWTPFPAGPGVQVQGPHFRRPVLENQPGRLPEIRPETQAPTASPKVPKRDGKSFDFPKKPQRELQGAPLSTNQSQIPRQGHPTWGSFWPKQVFRDFQGPQISVVPDGITKPLRISFRATFGVRISCL